MVIPFCLINNTPTGFRSKAQYSLKTVVNIFNQDLRQLAYQFSQERTVNKLKTQGNRYRVHG